jgi:hypothetical protein
MYNEQYFLGRKQELQQEALKVKLRHSDKVFQLAIELDQDIQTINAKMNKLTEEEKVSKEKDEPNPKTPVEPKKK